MQVRHRFACLSAAVVAALYGGSTVQARDLVWGPDTSGNWNTTDANWIDATATPPNVTFSSAIPDSVTLGNATTAATQLTPNYLTLTEAITVQNLTFGVSAGGAAYNVQDDFASGSLTLAGDVIKAAGTGTSQILLLNSALTLTAGQHTFVIRDTPNNVAELTINAPIVGAGGLTLDNGAGNDAFGTLLVNFSNSYQGATNILKGRMVITDGQALGSTAAGTTIGDLGTLSFGGTTTTLNTPVPTGDVIVAEPITITRNTYSGGAYGNNPSAIVSANDGVFNTHTFTGAFNVESTDARVRADTNRIVIASNLATTTAGTLSLDGDFAGFIRLSGDNTAFGNAGGRIRILGGVEVEAASEANLGGPTSKLVLNGGTIRPTGALGATGSAFMTNFGAHDLSGATINTGLDLDATQKFTVNNLSGQAIGTRGTGTIEFGGANTFTGQPFFDNGTVNILAGSATTFGGLRLRSPTMNIAGALTVNNSYNSIGVDTAGTNGGPDKATINITGNGSLTQTNGADFNVSDNPSTEGTINLSGNAKLTTVGTTWFGKGANTRGTLKIDGSAAFQAGSLVFVGQGNGSIGTVTQNGGSINLTRGGDFTFVLGDGRDGRVATGNYTLTAGTFTSAGEVFVGEGGAGTGTWTQSGGTVQVNNWFVVGREGGKGTVDLSGGTITKAGGGNSEVDVTGGVGTSTMTIRNAAEYRAQTGYFAVGLAGGGSGILNLRDNAKLTVSTGEFWVANGGATGVVNIEDNATLTVSNWLAIGRGGGSVGTLNLKGGSIVKTAGSGGFLAVGSNGTGSLIQTGGTMNVFGTRLGEASDGTMTISAGTDVFTGAFSLGHENNRRGTLNISGTANVTVPDVIYGVVGAGTGGGTINLDGGTLTGGTFTAGATSTGARTFNFNGGTLRVANDTTNFIGQKITSVVKAGGAKIDSNGKAVTINSALTHDAALGATADGGLTKSGAGTVTLAAANTYTGGTTVNGGTLVMANAAAVNNGSLTIASGATARVGTTAAPVNVSSLTVAGAGVADVNNGRLVINYGSGANAESQVRGLLVSGFNGGTWDGPGINSSAAANDLATGGRPTAVGYFDNAIVQDATYATNAIVTRYTLYGDSTLDGTVDIDNDFNLFLAGLSGQGSGWLFGDYSYDNVVDIDNDFNLFLAGLSANGGVNGAAMLSAMRADGLLSAAQFGEMSAMIAAVPEPGTLAAFGLAAVGLAGRRRRRVVAATA